MAGVKFMVMYPRPQDTDTFEHLYQDEDVQIGDGLSSEYFGTFVAFEKLYQEEHVPMIQWDPATVLPYRRGAFPSLQALRACAQSDGGRETLAHAVKISSGGTPLYRGRDHAPFWHRISMGPAERDRVSPDTPASAVFASRSAIELRCFP